MDIRLQREKLVAELSNAHAHRAIEISGSGSEATVRELKNKMARLEDDLARSRDEMSRLTHKNR